MHWIAERMQDPVGRVLKDLDFLAFRRSLVLAIAPGGLCVHKDCRERFQQLDFFGTEEVDIVEVDGKKEALEAGSRGGWLCCCGDSKDSPAALFKEKS